VPGKEGGREGGLGVAPEVLSFFGRLFDETEETLSVEKAMLLLEKGAREWQGGREGGLGLGGEMAVDPELKFTYEEEAEAESFFVPYIWEVVHAKTKEDVWWVTACISVFDPPLPPSLPPSVPLSTAEEGGKGVVGKLLAGAMGVVPSSLASSSSSSSSHSHSHSQQPQQHGGNGSSSRRSNSSSRASPPPVVVTMHV